MPRFSVCRSHWSVVKIAPFIAMLAVAWFALPGVGAAAHLEGPFARFSGNWRGSGHVVSADGRSEPINCRAHYDVSEGGTNLTQSLICASDSYRVDIRAEVAAQGQSFQGTWQETTRNVSGNLSGQIGEGVFEGTVTGMGFTAGISLRVSGRRQSVEIRPSAGDITKIEVALARAG
jgi:hypothetical protein